MRTILIICFLALFFPSVNAQISTKTYNANAQDAYDRAMSQKEAGQDRAAKAALHEAIKFDPNYVDALRQLADYHYTENLLDSAIFYYDRNVNIIPRDLFAHNWLVTIYLQQKNYEAALGQYDAILRTFTDRPTVQADVYFKIAETEFSYMNRWQNAITTGEEAMKRYLGLAQMVDDEKSLRLVNQKAAQARMIAAKGYFLLGNYKIALKYLKENAKHLGSEAEYQFFLGNTYYELGKTEKGIPLVRQAILQGYEIPREVLESGYELPKEFMMDHSEYKKDND